MARRLNQTVMVGARIFEAGTPESEIDAVITLPGVWDGEPSEVVDEGDRGALLAALADAKGEVAVLAERVAELEAEVEALSAVKDADDVTPAPYEGWEVDALKAEIDARNGDGRETKIDKRGNAETLTARLIEDDESKEK